MEPRQIYTGHLPLDLLCEKARRAAERDGRLRYVYDSRVSLRPERTGNMIVMGAEDWAGVNDGRWVHKVYV